MSQKQTKICVTVFIVLVAVYLDLNFFLTLTAIFLCWKFLGGKEDETKREEKPIDTGSTSSDAKPTIPVVETKEEKFRVPAAREIGLLLGSLLQYQTEIARADKEAELLTSLENVEKEQQQVDAQSYTQAESEITDDGQREFVAPNPINVDEKPVICVEHSSRTQLELLTGCECIPIKKEQIPNLVELFSEYRMDGKSNGYCPMIVDADEFTLKIIKNNVACDIVDEEQIKVAVEAYHKKMLNADLEDGKKLLADMLAKSKVYSNDWEPVAEKPIGIPSEEASDGSRFFASEDDDLYLVKVKVAEPWKVWAYIACGSWYSCPSVEHHMAISKYWFETHGAVPAVVNGGYVNYLLDRPAYYAREVALEQYAYCPDIVERGYGTIAALENFIKDAKVWHFWWN